MMCIARLLLAVSLLTSCTRENSESDYRASFEGEYIGQLTTTSWSLNGGSSTTSGVDTVVVISLGDSLVRIDLTEIYVDKNGDFFEQGQASISSYYTGSFYAGDSLRIDMNTGGLGGGLRTSFLGRKN